MRSARGATTTGVESHATDAPQITGEPYLEAEPQVEIERFLDHLSNVRRLSGHTRQGYGRDLTALFADGVTPATCDSDKVRQALSRMHARGLSPRSLARALSAWRTFFDWRQARVRGQGNPCGGLRPPRARKGLPKALSPDAAAALLARRAESLLETRDAAMFELLYSSGLRLAELCAIDLDQALAAVRLGEIRVIGKGNKQRIVPVGRVAREAMERWLAVRASIAGSLERAAFVSSSGRRLSGRSVQVRLNRWARQSQLTQPVHPHALRHSFATHMLQSSGDLRAVQEMLGHANISTTQIYTSLDFQHLASVYDQAHPRARKK